MISLTGFIISALALIFSVWANTPRIGATAAICMLIFWVLLTTLGALRDRPK